MRTQKDIFKEEGFTIVEENETNPLLAYLKEHHPGIIKDNEINLEALKAAAGLPIDEKVNGYGLNFVGRNVARSRYAAKTEKELKVNKNLSKDFDTTQNLVLKGDNLDSLKLLKSHYSGKIKCVYIDPPYNTTSDEFVYPDKFDKEETKVLGLVDLSDDDIERLEFSFTTKKSHSGWLAFMYPRLLLARDLLREDGVIFISIDDNEQANLKLLCDEVFGEENFVAKFDWRKKTGANDAKDIAVITETILLYAKSHNRSIENEIWQKDEKSINQKRYRLEDEFIETRGKFYFDTLDRGGLQYSDSMNFGIKAPDGGIIFPNGRAKFVNDGWIWKWSREKVKWGLENNFLEFVESNKSIGSQYTIKYKVYQKVDNEGKIRKKSGRAFSNLITEPINQQGNEDFGKLFEKQSYFSNPKPVKLIYYLLNTIDVQDSIILDFFAGSGTTGHAVMQLNAEDGGNRKFILCQIDEPIAEDKPAYQFCKGNDLEPVISSITIERLRRAGEQIKSEIEEKNQQKKEELNFSTSDTERSRSIDVGFKVFDTVNAPKLDLKDGEIVFENTETDTLSRIYNMIFSVGIDDPTSRIETVVQDCVYKIGDHYYLTNSAKISNEKLAKVVKSGKVFVDGWTAGINTSLQQYKKEVKIVF